MSWSLIAARGVNQAPIDTGLFYDEYLQEWVVKSLTWEILNTWSF